MDVWAAAGWGLTGGLCVEALELYAQIRRARRWSWRRPIPQGMAAFVVSVVIRVGMGAVVAAATAGSGQVSGPLAALALGIAAPLVIEKLARAIPLTVGAPDSVAAMPDVLQRLGEGKTGPGRSARAALVDPLQSTGAESAVEGAEDAR